MLQRVQILLDEEIRRDLAFLSELRNQSVSQLVRSLLGPRLKEERKKIKNVKKMSGPEALLKMAKEAEKIDKKYGSDYPTDLSINHDYYLYGAPKRNPK